MKKTVLKAFIGIMVILCFALLPLSVISAAPAETGNAFDVQNFVYFSDVDELTDFISANNGKTAAELCDDKNKLGAYEFILSGEGFIYLPGGFDGFSDEQWVNGIIEDTGIYISDNRIVIIGAQGNQKYMLTCTYAESSADGETVLPTETYKADGIDGDVKFATGGGASYYFWEQDGYAFSIWMIDGLEFDEYSNMIPAQRISLSGDIVINEPVEIAIEEIE